MSITVKTYKSRLAKWLDNLVNRKFKQTTGQLFKLKENSDELIAEAHCCLSVAVQTYNECQPKKLEIKIESVDYYTGPQTDGMPDIVAEWLGLTTKGQDLCIDMNDSQNKKFYQIKRELERHPEKYFHWAKKDKNEK